jgi:hypothetical protein
VLRLRIARKVQAGQGRAGVGVIAPAAGIAAFAALLTQPQAQVGVMPIHWPLWLQKSASAFYHEFVQASARLVPLSSAAAAAPVLLQQLAEAL